MSTNRGLKLIAAAIVAESKLTKGARLQLLKFLQYEATDIQVKAMLLDGKILHKIDGQTASVIEDRFAAREGIIRNAFLNSVGLNEDFFKEFNWNKAIKEDVQRFSEVSDQVNLDEEFTDREKTFLFGGIQRLFGQCAAKCGRITIFSKANACKDNCIAKRDAAIKAGRAKMKAAKAQAAGKTAKAAKFTQKAKDIQGYAK